MTLPDGGAELTDIRGDVVWLPEGAPPAEVWVFIASRTGMMVKRAAAGAEGYVLDHYDRAALQAHLDAVGAPLLEALRGLPPATVFCDSLEVFGSDWTPDLLPEFTRRRGYDLRPHLAALVSGTDAPAIARAPGLGPHARRALRGALPGAARRVDARPRHHAAHPGLRRPAGDAVEQPPR